MKLFCDRKAWRCRKAKDLNMYPHYCAWKTSTEHTCIGKNNMAGCLNELCNVSDELPLPTLSCGQSNMVQGKYQYYHYACDGINDRGWGCGYRTLQTICSWINFNTPSKHRVPSHREIQDILVLLEDKLATFAGSREWIGSFEGNSLSRPLHGCSEVCLVIDHLYNVPCKILHVGKGSNLKSIAGNLKEHFQKFGSPVMMGGDQDASSKGLLGICSASDDDIYILVLDPHFVGKNPTKEMLQKEGWVKWQHLNDFSQSSFYNLCLPQIAPSREH